LKVFALLIAENNVISHLEH